jgi:hypothetical protein
MFKDHSLDEVFSKLVLAQTEAGVQSRLASTQLNFRTKKSEIFSDKSLRFVTAEAKESLRGKIILLRQNSRSVGGF